MEKVTCNTKISKKDLFINTYKIYFIVFSIFTIILPLIAVIFIRKFGIFDYIFPIFFFILALLLPLVSAYISRYTINVKHYNNDYKIILDHNLIIITYEDIKNIIEISNISQIRKMKNMVMDSINVFISYFFHYSKTCQLNNPFSNKKLTYEIKFIKPIIVNNIEFDTTYRGWLIFQPIIKKFINKPEMKCKKCSIYFSEKDYTIIKKLIDR